MTKDPAFCAPETDLKSVAEMMRRHDCGEIPVVDESGRLSGIVAQADLALKSSPGRLHHVVRQVSQHAA